MIVGLVVFGLFGMAGIEPAHETNPIYKSLLTDGLTLGGLTVGVPAPAVTDGMAPDAERAALKAIAGSESALNDLVRDAVTAPHILKLRDQKTAAGDMIRMGDLWFVVRAKLDDIRPDQVGGELNGGQPVEAGNMRFSTEAIPDAALARLGITPPARDAKHVVWFVHHQGRLLDRLNIEVSNQIEGTRAADSWVIAARSDPRFDKDPKYPNLWQTIVLKGAKEELGKPQPPAGGASYVKVSKLSSVPGALLIESHFAFLEPKGWFDGQPTLRSKFGIVAQDRVRTLRRDLKSQADKGGRNP